MRPTIPDIIRPSLLALALVALAPSPVVAKVSSRVEKVKKLYDQLFFDDAMEVCRAVLDAGKNSREDLMVLLLYKGVLSAVQNKPAEAVTAFQQLLVVNPLTKMGPEHPPRVRRAFALAQRWFQRQKPLMVAVDAPARVLRRGTLEVSAQVTSDPLDMVAHLVLRVRARGFGAFRSHLVDKGEKQSWSVALDTIQGVGRAASLDYYVAALDESYNELTLAGSAVDPRSIRLAGAPAPVDRPAPQVTHATATPAPSPAWYTRWWVWAAAGTVVTVAVIAIAATAVGPPGKVDAPITLESGGGP
jgi:hypothetical protein